MTFLSWFDDRTLMACLCMLVSVFSVMLLALRSLHQRLPGLTFVTIGFSTGAVATILLFSQGIVPLSLALVAGGGMTLVSSIFLYQGVLQFSRQQRPASGAGILPVKQSSAHTRGFLPLLCTLSLVSFLVIVWFTLVTPSEPTRVIALAGTIAFSRCLTSWTILRIARGRMHLRALGVTMAIVALAMAAQVLRAALVATAAHHLDPVHLETPSLLFGVLIVCIQGVLFLMMFTGSVTDSVHEQAQLDYLTGILNRRGIEAALQSELARTRRTRVCFAMLLIDVDHFKAINDRCGHACGDGALRLVAQTILQTVRIYDRVGRFGGDEFMLLLPQTDDTEGLLTANRILEEIRNLPPLMKGLPITVSIGVTSCWSQEDPLDVMTRADAALYEAKRAGRDGAQLAAGDLSPIPPASREWDNAAFHQESLALLGSEPSLPRKA